MNTTDLGAVTRAAISTTTTGHNPGLGLGLEIKLLRFLTRDETKTNCNFDKDVSHSTPAQITVTKPNTTRLGKWTSFPDPARPGHCTTSGRCSAPAYAA